MRILILLLCVACLALAGCGGDDEAAENEAYWDAVFNAPANNPDKWLSDDNLNRNVVGHTTDVIHSQETRWAVPYWVESTETTLTIHGNWCRDGWKNYWEIPRLDWAMHWIGVRNDETAKPQAKWNLAEKMMHDDGRRIRIHCTRRK